MAILLDTFAGPQLLKECWDGFEKGFDPSRGPWIQKHYTTDNWDATNAICDALMGSGALRLPHACPEAPRLTCSGARCLGLAEIDDRFGGRPRFRQGILEATYAIPPYVSSSGDTNIGPTFVNDGAPGQPFLFMEQRIDWDVELLKTPDHCYRYENSDTAVDVPVVVQVAVAKFVLIRKWQSLMPVVAIENYLNRLNSVPLFGQPRGLLRLGNVSTRRSFTSDGNRTQDIEYHFKYREVDHNWFLHPTDASFYKIVNSEGKPPYKYANIGAVLQ